MAAISSIFWILGFFLSVIIAPQLRIWTWGPTMLCFAVSTLSALPLIWRQRGNSVDLVIVISAVLLVFWIAVRASVSPVSELAQSDLLLTAMGVATFVTFRACAGEVGAQRILIAGLAIILAASVWVIGKQVANPVFSPVFPNSEPRHPAGFFAHYSYGASFLIPVSLILAAVAVHSKEHWLTRIFLGLIAASGMAAVYFTKSRGGFIGIGAGLVGFLLWSILSGNQQRKKWFAPAIIIFPILLIGLSVLFFNWLGDIQEIRDGSGEISGMMDNSIRFYLAGIAVSCFGLHPMFGGGSRSFSWECFQFWDTAAMGRGSAKPEHVHNELLQTATDYGAIGAGLVVIFLLIAISVAVWRVSSRHWNSSDSNYATSWRIGGAAGLIGLFAQSNFEGILRIPPGAILLAFCLSAACLPGLRNREESKSASYWLSASTISIFSIASVLLLSLSGWKGSLVTRKLWPVYFNPLPPGIETRADALSEAISIWPLGSLHHQRGMDYQMIGAARRTTPDVRKEFLGLALSDYQTAGKLNPFNPEFAVSSGVLLSALDRDKEAGEAFGQANALQGEMEPTFHANALYAKHLHRMGLDHFSAGDLMSALNSFQLAARHLDKVAEIYGSSLGSADERELRVNVHVNTGRTFEETGEFPEALAEYEIASELRDGSSAHYRAGVLLGKRAVTAWSERRSSDALALFIQALSRVSKARQLPEGVDNQTRTKYVSYLKKTIGYLKGARVEPSENPGF